MSCGDVRGLLQYVPQFGGKVFVIIVDTPVAALAETMLDLLALQNIGVQLVIASTLHSKEVLLDRAAEVELKFCHSEQNLLTPAIEVASSLKRGQATVVSIPTEEVFSAELISFACRLSAKKLIYLQGEGERLPVGAIPAADIGEGASSLLLASAAACNTGIARVHVLDGADFGVLLSELFSNEGVGTMIYADSYRVVRAIREEDIVELLGMIGRSVRNAHLVPRYYAEIESQLQDYFVMEIDGNVVGSVALYQYEGTSTGEVACLYVKQSHEGQGYASELVSYVHQHAKAIGLSRVFSLTNRVAAFFQEKLGYQEIKIEDIPLVRQEQLRASGRDSRAFSLDF